MIAWTYLDKKSASAEALKDYHAMDYIIQNHKNAVSEVRAGMTTIRSSVPDGMPHTPRPRAGEERLAAAIDTIDILKERYRQALEYMDWFTPAWEKLTDTEQTILTELYQSSSMRSGAIARLERILGYGHSQIDRLRSKALARFSHLLFGV
jgi:hypothetical protein